MNPIWESRFDRQFDLVDRKLAIKIPNLSVDLFQRLYLLFKYSFWFLHMFESSIIETSEKYTLVQEEHWDYFMF